MAIGFADSKIVTVNKGETVRKERHIQDVQCVVQEGGFEQESRRCLKKSMDTFLMEGEQAVVARFLQERTSLAVFSVPLSVAVERGSIGREAAIAVVQEMRGSPQKHIEIIALCFPARGREEDLQAFHARKKVAYERVITLDGITPAHVQHHKERIRDILESYHQLEAVGMKGLEWPMRADGQPRRSFIDRAEMMNIARSVSGYAARVRTDRDEVLQELREAKFPQNIQEHADILPYVARAGERVKAVTYDMFDTLVQFSSNSAERQERMNSDATAFLREKGFGISEKDLRKLRDSVLHDFRLRREQTLRDYKQVDALELVIQKIALNERRPIDPVQIRALAQELEGVYCLADGATAVVMPGAKSTLEDLRSRGKKLAVISNFSYSQESVERLLKRFGLFDYFDEVIVSSEHGMLKSPKDPNGTIFREACRRLGVAPEALVHVGDHSENDQKAPQRIGAKGVVLKRPNALIQNKAFQSMDIHSEKYADIALQTQREYLTGGANEYFDRVKKTITPEALRPFAERVYEMSRDKYGPLVIQFAEHTLQRLAESPKGTMSLCLGRDAIAMFLIQRQLLKLFPERFPGLTADRIQYIPVSRASAVKSSDDLVREQLRGLGVENAQRIILIDNGISGTIQNRFAELYPEKEFIGEYLFARKLSHDVNRNQKHGFILEEECKLRIDPDTGMPLLKKQKDGSFMEMWDRIGIRTDVNKTDALSLFSSDAVHGHEDIWNGIFASAEPLVRHKEGQVRPKNWTGSTMELHNYVEGRPDVIPGLEFIANHRILKKIALKGIMDSLSVYQRQIQLQRGPTKQAVIHQFADWFRKSNKADSLDRRLLDGLVRAR